MRIHVAWRCVCQTFWARRRALFDGADFRPEKPVGVSRAGGLAYVDAKAATWVITGSEGKLAGH